VPQRGRPDPGKFRAGCVRVFLLPFGGSLPAISSGCKKRLPGGDAPDPARRNGARGGTGRARNPFPAEAVAVGRRPVPPSGRANPLPRLLPMVRREEAPALPAALPSPVTPGMAPCRRGSSPFPPHIPHSRFTKGGTVVEHWQKKIRIPGRESGSWRIGAIYSGPTRDQIRQPCPAP